MDTLTKEQRRKAMRAVKSKDSKIEVRLRQVLWSRGHRYRKHYSKLVGTPDIVFVSSKLAIFCDSDFWHGHDWENRKHDFKSNRGFWHAKIERNMARDKEVTETLEAQGWTVLRFWGHEIKNELDKCVTKIEETIARKRESQDT